MDAMYLTLVFLTFGTTLLAVSAESRDYNQFAEENSYVYVVGSCEGNDLDEPEIDATLEKCAKICKDWALCVSFVWKEEENLCLYKNRSCTPETGLQQGNDNIFNFVFDHPRHAERMGYDYQWADCEGGDLDKSWMKTRDPTPCYELCQKKEGCWAFVVWSRLCLLKIGDCKITKSKAMWHTFMKRNHMSEQQRMNKWGEMSGFEYQAGGCADRLRILATVTKYTPININTCRLLCIRKETCQGIIWSGDGSKCVARNRRCRMRTREKGQYLFERGDLLRDYTTERGDCSGFDFGRKMQGMTLEDCARTCNRNPQCKSFVSYDWTDIPGAYCQQRSHACNWLAYAWGRGQYNSIVTYKKRTP